MAKDGSVDCIETTKDNHRLKKQNLQLEKKLSHQSQRVANQKEQVTRILGRVQSNFRDTVRALVDLMEMFHPALGGHCKRVAMLARKTVQQLELPSQESSSIEMAAALHDIGMIGLPTKLFDTSPDRLSPEEQKIFYTHTDIGYKLLSRIDFLKKAALLILFHHHELENISPPHAWEKGAFMIGLRILQAVDFCDRAIHKNKHDIEDVIPMLRQRMPAKTREDAKILSLVETGIRKWLGAKGEHPVKLHQLRPNMILSRDVKTKDGKVLMMVEGSVLTDIQIIRLKALNQLSPLGKIWVYEE